MSQQQTTANHTHPRERLDDPLLDSLLSLCNLHHRPASRATLSSGLPLVEHRITPELLPRAAARAGLQGRLLRRQLDDISDMALPAILLLKGGRSLLLLAINPNNTARVMPSESDGGEITVSLQKLAKVYSGQAFFAQPRHRFDIDRGELIPRTKSWFRDTLRHSRKLYADAIGASLIINLIGLCIPLFVMNVYDRVVPNHATATLWVLALGVLGAFVFDLVLKTLRGLCLDLAGKKTDLIISATLFERITGMSMANRPARVGSFAQHIHDFQSLRDFLSSLTLASLIDLPFTLIILAVIALIGGNMFFIPFLAFPIAAVIGLLLQRPLADLMQRTMELSSERQSGLIETLSGLDAVKVNNAESERQYLWEHTIGTLSRLELRAKLISSFALNSTVFLQQSAGVITIVFGVYKIIDGDLSMGGLIACYMLGSRALAPLTQISGLLTRYQQAKVTLNSINQMMELPQERQQQEKPLKKHSFKGGIEFRQVSFNYPEQEQPALRDINLKIEPGEKVGIIGRSGSGKSSLSKLIVGLNQPSQGSLLIDGMDIRQLDVSDLRHNIGYVPQDIHLFSGSLRDNITSGARYVEDELILQAAELSGVHGFASIHPKGYELQVGEHGRNLSGGQRQNLALARALLLDPPILLMDEPTSAMDNATEERIKRTLAEITSNKTLLLITHRASMLSLVNRLIIVDRGRIIADGPKQSVMEALKKGQISVG